MPEFTVVCNDGPNVRNTNYWTTALAERGFVFLSGNAGAMRLLVPESMQDYCEREGWATAKNVEVLYYPSQQLVALVFEDGTATPAFLQISTRQVDRLPSPSEQGRLLTFSVWFKGGKQFELPCRYRKVDGIWTG